MVFEKVNKILIEIACMIVVASLLGGCTVLEKGKKEETGGIRAVNYNSLNYGVVHEEIIDNDILLNSFFCPVSSGYVYISENAVIYNKGEDDKAPIYKLESTSKAEALNATTDDRIVLVFRNTVSGDYVSTVFDLKGNVIWEKTLGSDNSFERVESVNYVSNRLYVITEKKISSVGKDDIKEYTLRDSECKYWKCFNGEDIVLYGDDAQGSALIAIDRESLDKKDERSFREHMAWVKSDNGIVYSSVDGLARFDTTKESDELLVMFSQIGVAPSNVKAVSFFDNNIVAVTIQGKENKILFLALAGKEQIEEQDNRKTLTFASVNPPLYSTATSLFNKTNTKYKIEMLPAITLEKYNLAVSTGEADLFELFGTRYEVLARKGYLYNIKELLESSTLIKKEDYLERVYSDFEIDGNIYAVPKTMFLQCLCAPENLLDGKTNWTVDEFLDFMEVNPGALSDEYYKNVADIKTDITMCAINIDDILGKEGYINKARLKDILIRIEKLDVPIISKSTERKLKDGEAAIISVSITTPEQFSDYQTQLGCKLIPIGYPAKEGELSRGNVVYSNLVGISSTTKNNEAAWEFAELYAYKEIDSYTNEVPTTKIGFEEAMNQGVDREKQRINGVEYYPIDQEEIETVRNAYYKAGIYTDFYIALTDIIWEEVQYYYSGEKTVDEVVGVIDSRVRLMVDEQRP